MTQSHSQDRNQVVDVESVRKKGRVLPLALGAVGIIGLALIAVPLTVFAQPAVLPETVPADTLTWKTTIAAISDLDQAVAGYATGKLGLLQGQSDTLTILSGPNPVATASVGVTNSVIGWPTTVRASRDGRFLYIAEIRGQAPAGTQTIKQPYVNFPKGNVLSIVDTTNRAAPPKVISLPVGLNPSSVDVSADGAYLAVTSDEATAPLFVWRLRDGVPVGAPQRFEVAFPKTGARLGLRALRFHPQLPVLAINLSDQQVGFFRLSDDGTNIQVTPHGAAIAPDLPNIVLTEVEWTPDGRHLLVPNVGWGDQTPRYMLTTKPGHLVSIAFDGQDGAAHKIASIVEVGRSPEGIEISPDGKFAVAVNMERTYLPGGAFFRTVIGGTTAASLSLVAIDPNGQLTAAAPVRFNAALPEDALFDSDGRTLALAVYERPGSPDNKGYVEFWRISGEGPGAKLVRIDYAVSVPRGVHDLERLSPP